MRLVPCTLILTAVASAAAANPVVDPDWKPTAPGILRVLAPERAVRVHENRSERLLDAGPDRPPAWTAVPPHAPPAPCPWTTECRDGDPAGGGHASVAFESESVEITLDPPDFEVRGRYVLRKLI
ncbi:MAG TPA: hypothetical protein VKU85_00705, partial [bacterium]|nr:hypothetical protein [bacterium]